MSTDLLEQAFDYKLVSKQTAKELREHASWIRERVAMTMLDVAARLKAAKRLLPHGDFLTWVQSCTGLESRTAQRMIRAYDVFKCDTVSHCQGNLLDSAMYLLSSDSCPDGAREEAIRLAQDGMVVGKKIAQQLIDKHSDVIETVQTSERSYEAAEAKPPIETDWSDDDTEIYEDEDEPLEASAPLQVSPPKVAPPKSCAEELRRLLSSASELEMESMRLVLEEFGFVPQASKGNCKTCKGTGYVTIDLSIPESLDTPGFREAWEEWECYMRERKKGFTATTRKRQLKQCESWGPEGSERAIHFSIRQGYQGLFPESKGKGFVPQDQGMKGSNWTGAFADDGQY